MAFVGIALALLVLALPVIGVVLTIRWARRLWSRRTSMGSAARTASGVAVLGAAVSSLGVLSGFLRVFGSIGGERVDPSERARVLAEGISEAMNFGVFGLALFVPSFLVLRRMGRKSSKA